MAHVVEEEDDLSPTSGVEESELLSPTELEPEPEPGLNGTPVHCEY
jgi:phosphatidylserine synthase 2